MPACEKVLRQPGLTRLALVSMLRATLAIFLFSVSLIAQAPINGTLKGRVVDPQGLAVENAKVELSAQSGVSRAQTLSNPAGEVGFARVTPGRYKVTVQKAGPSARRGPPE